MGVTRVRALIKAPLPRVWEFVIKPENLHVWGPATQPVTGFDRPFQVGDRVTQYRRDFIRTEKQVLLVEQIVPYQALHLRDLSPAAARMNVTATLSVAEADAPDTTWIVEDITYSFGSSRLLQALDRGLVSPVFQWLAGYKGRQVFSRLQAILENPPEDFPLGSGQMKHTGA